MNKVVIENGIVKSGIMDKSILGGKNGGIIHLAYNEFSILL